MLGVREHSELYLAKQSYVDRAVVIEVLRPNSPQELAELFQEMVRRRAAASLPHVVPVLESAQTGHLRYLIQELPQGKPLAVRVQEEGTLTMEQAFTFIQAVADMYCACLEQGMAAHPLTLDSIYMDGNNFSFFSPVISGAITDEQRVAQMEAFADILETVLDPGMVEKSNLSIIMHWLRFGYGNMPLEWAPLATSLSTLRAQKFAEQKESIDWRELLKPSTLKRRGKRTLRAMRANMAFGGVVAGLMLLAGVAVALLSYYSQNTSDLPAVTDDYVYCGTAGRVWRVQTRPVSIEEYGAFLDAWNKMTNAQKKDLCEGMPSGNKNLTPWQWSEQSMAASFGTEWQGKNISRETPVCGVSYWGALAYARYVKGGLPSVAQLKVVRQKTGEPMVEEWTSSGMQASFPLDPSYVVYPAYGGEPTQEVDPNRQTKQRSFRVVFEQNTTTES